MERLVNKAYKEYGYFSRYTSFPYYYNTEDKKYVYGTTSHINQNATYVLHKVKQNETYDSIALDYYNNPTFFWVICDFNKVQNPFTKPAPDTMIKVPTLADIGFKEV